MIRVLFICHGNICRSTMAEFLFKHMLTESGYSYADNLLIKGWQNDKLNLEEMHGAAERGHADFYIDSAATSREEIGEPVERRTVAKLKEHGIACGTHYARQITRTDYDFFDFIVVMDMENLRGMKRIIPDDPENKIHFMMEFADKNNIINNESAYSLKNPPRDVSDPWYTHNFEQTYQDLVVGCSGLIDYIKLKH